MEESLTDGELPERGTVLFYDHNRERKGVRLRTDERHDCDCCGAEDQNSECATRIDWVSRTSTIYTRASAGAPVCGLPNSL